MLGWMEWTTPTAAFFILLAVALTGMTLWDIRDPSVKTQGFLPVAFTRGERFFLSVIAFFGVMLLWVALLPNVTLWYALLPAAVLIFVLVRFA